MKGGICAMAGIREQDVEMCERLAAIEASLEFIKDSFKRNDDVHDKISADISKILNNDKDKLQRITKLETADESVNPTDIGNRVAKLETKTKILIWFSGAVLTAVIGAVVSIIFG
jgi:hypothetical protein